LFKLGEDAPMDRSFWNQVIEVRDAVSKQLEGLRVAGQIGSSLNAEVDLYCGTELFQQLRRLDDELRFVTITSYARVHRETERDGQGRHYTLANGDEVWITVAPSEQRKCIRCWHHRQEVGSIPEHPDLCGRCVENVDGAGEVRRFA
jgi:isoleucyl-tRNA synthetase